MDSTPWPLTFIYAIFIFVYFQVLILIYSRLKNFHPELWATLVWRPENKVAKFFTALFIWSMYLNAILKFVNRKAYKETGDNTLIKLGSTLHIMNYGWIIIIVGGLIVQWL